MNTLLRRGYHLPRQASHTQLPLSSRRPASTGSRNARGHGWLQKYRSDRGGRHLQGRYHYRDLPELDAINDRVFAMNDAHETNEVYLDLAVAGKSSHRIVIELASKALPHTAANFKLLCRDKSYAQSTVYKIEKTVGLCMGDILYNTGQSGRCHPSLSTPASPYSFKDEGYYISHTSPGIVSMMSPGVHSNDSRFLITTSDAPQLDGRFVAFGRVKEGMMEGITEELVKGVFTKRGRPTVDIVVTDCGLMG